MLEKVEYHTLDEKEACDFIKRIRNYYRKYTVGKTISSSIGTEENKKINTYLNISINKITGNMRLGHSISWGSGFKVYPTKNQKLKCTDKRTLDYVNHCKKMLSPKRKQTIRFCINIGKNIELLETVDYYADVGNVGTRCCFHSKKGLIYIDEK